MSLQSLINARKKKAFMPDYDASDEEALGLVISSHFEWDGLAILKSLMYALEDANFHTEAALVEEMIKKVETE